MTDSILLRSDAWIGLERYEDEYVDRIIQFNKQINLDALKSYVSMLRENRPCQISAKFSVGVFNLVRKITFDDGVQWIARLRMPPIPDNHQHTSIPIPRVYGYQLEDENLIGCPFSIIEYIHGNTAYELFQTYRVDHDSIPEEFEEKFWRQMAQLMVQLASIRLPKMGSITHGDDAPNSFTSSARGERIAWQTELIVAFLTLSWSFEKKEKSHAEGFGLVNFDLGSNNIIVDEEFNFLAVIDWSMAIAVPDAVLYRFQNLMGISIAMPGKYKHNELTTILNRYRQGLRLAKLVEELSLERGGSADESTEDRQFIFTKSGFYCKEALAFQSLSDLHAEEGCINKDWMHGLEWLKERSEAQTADFY
ncbi:hypothetical protein PT974_01134 [Cladobotryum mycophilum]|uniref:Aminoglycoside phosphotransferase domain-containing protein n=1 Tax=Cladobotryum mycophilum TaxID=491253 RepID=A0ABR0T327_9HYPO